MKARANGGEVMPYTPIPIDRSALTIMGVQFPDLRTLENTAEAIGSNMFEGYRPTRHGIEIIRDYCAGKLTFADMAKLAREKSYAE
jgi:putative transcriptional regulator